METLLAVNNMYGLFTISGNSSAKVFWNWYVCVCIHGRAQRGVCTAEDGRRENVVQLRTLKRTRLASLRENMLGGNIDNLDINTERKKNHFLLSNSTIAPNEFPVDNFECAHSQPAIVSTLYRKNKTELKVHVKKRKVKRREANQRKEKKEGGKKNGGPRRCPPLRCR